MEPETLTRLRRELLLDPKLCRKLLRTFPAEREPEPVVIRTTRAGVDRAIAVAIAVAVGGVEAEIRLAETENPAG